MEVQGRVLRRLYRQGDPGWGTSPSEYDPEAAKRLFQKMRLFFGPGRYFRVDAQGFENLPPAPCLLVSNHSGGTSIPDAWGLFYAWHDRLGFDRPVHVLVHELVLSTRLTGPTFAKIGALRASPERAEQALRGGHDVVVMPGGERDTWRTWKRRYEVEFAGRTGYARLALRTGVPIVPIANAGAHETLMVLTDGAAFARRLGLPKLARASVFPVHLSLPWGLTFGPLPHLPTPARLRYRIGPPVPPPAGFVPGTEPTEAQVAAYDAAVRAAMQGLLDGLKAERARPRRR